jgi:hypothetical protein
MAVIDALLAVGYTTRRPAMGGHGREILKVLRATPVVLRVLVAGGPDDRQVTPATEIAADEASRQIGHLVLCSYVRSRRWSASPAARAVR